jgi:uncharacterized protein (TIGR00369 family)
MSKEELLQELANFDQSDLEIALKAARASKLEREEGFYFLHYFFEEDRDTDSNEAIITMPIQPIIHNPLHMVHGGVTAFLCDNVMGYASLMEAQRPGVTLEMSVRYHKPGRGKYLRARAEVVSKGSQLNSTVCQVRDDNGTLIATASGTFYHKK